MDSKNFTVGCRVSGDNGPEENSSDHLEEGLFADITSNQKRRRHIIASQTVVSIEYLPGMPDLQLEGDTRKGNSVTLFCILIDPGHPKASRFVWTRDEKELDETTSFLTL